FITHEDRTVFRKREAARRDLGWFPVCIVGAAFDVVDLLPVELERNAQFDQWLCLALSGLYTIAGCRDFAQMARTDGPECRSRRSTYVNRSPACKVALERTCDFLFDLFPCGVGNRGKLAVQIIHVRSLLLGIRYPTNYRSRTCLA